MNMTQPQDFLGYLYAEWCKAKEARPGERETIQSFLNDARETLSQNQPVSTTTLGSSLALALQDGTAVVLVDNDGVTEGQEPDTMQKPEFQPTSVTVEQKNKAKNQGKTEDSFSQNITSN
jgi:hypothetical protein